MRALHVEGSPGLGKTQIPSQVAAELGIGFKVIHAPLLQPEDYGFPCISTDKKTVNFIVSESMFPLTTSDCPETGILLIDEIAQAGTNEQKILTNVIYEREIHGKKLKTGWVIVTTGNRAKDRAGANRLLSHLANRITRVELEPSLDDWTNFALASGVKPEVISFLRFKSNLLNNFDAQSEINATPRSWIDGVSKSLGTLPSDLEYQTIRGDVGEGPATEFLGFLRVCRELPSVDAIILNPEGVEVPAQGKCGVLYALSTSLAHRATPLNFPKLLSYARRMPPEFTTIFVRDSIRLCPDVQATKDFISWMSTDGVKLLS